MIVGQNELVMSFDPKTIQHLGIRMYSTLPPVLAELIANSYDADAETVTITLNDSNGKKEISVDDDGIGMSFTEINDKFLKIGRDRRYEEGSQNTPKGRKVIGKKGLGKLSFFGIAQEVEVFTKKGGKENAFKMQWEKIKTSKDEEYKPDVIHKDKKCPDDEKGTKIILKDIKRESDFDINALADGLSKVFIVDRDFKIILKYNTEDPIIIDNERKYNGLDKEIEWDIPGSLKVESNYKNKKNIRGHLIATEYPISPKTNMRGITLFSRKKLVNLPEYFSNSTSSHFFSYLTGWLEVDFIDDLEEDVISTNRQSLNWDNPEMSELRDYLLKMMNWLERDWRIKRAELREIKVEKNTGIKISDWFSKLPKDVKENVEPLVKAMIKNFEPTEEAKEVNSLAIKSLHSIAPEYTYWHYRNLHPAVKTMAEEDYKKGDDYFLAAEKASRSYIREVKNKAVVDEEKEQSNMDKAFSLDSGKLIVNNCSSVTERTIQHGQHFLSKGLVAGCRNPLDHSFPQYQEKLLDTGLFTEKDCLDMLSLVSHLFRRLDNSKLRETYSLSQSPPSIEK